MKQAFFVYNNFDLAYTIQLLDDREDEESCEQADNHQGSPNYRQWHIPHMARDRNQLGSIKFELQY